MGCWLSERISWKWSIWLFDWWKESCWYFKTSDEEKGNQAVGCRADDWEQPADWSSQSTIAGWSCSGWFDKRLSKEKVQIV